MNNTGILFLFVICYLIKREGPPPKKLTFYKGEKNSPAGKRTKREESDDFTKEITPLQRPRRSSKKR